MKSLDHAYRYAAPSVLDGPTLRLASSGNEASAAPFLRARVLAPRLVALGLRTVSDVVRSRHHIPAAMLARILLEADPVLTWGGDTLRVEGFSSCCGVYARLDLDPHALDVAEASPGTTNVDFGQAMRDALARVRDGDTMTLAVGQAGVALTHAAGPASESVVERRVALPRRWMRGFLEVQSVLPRMERRMVLGRTDAVRFLRALPRPRRTSEAIGLDLRGARPRVVAAGRPDVLRLAGPARLRAFDALAPMARELTVYEDPRTGASTWVLALAAGRLSLTSSPETWRGFSGEGQALSALATEPPPLARAQAALSWQSELTPEGLAAATGLELEDARRALVWLGTRGVVGYDVTAGSWFHRVLPFDLETATRWIEEEQPRLRAARELHAAGAVRWRVRGETVDAEVTTDVVHRVQLGPDDERCTCPWYAKHRGERGPCKHVLAVQLAVPGDAR